MVGGSYVNAVGLSGNDRTGDYVVLGALGRIGICNAYPHSLGPGTFGFFVLEDPKGLALPREIERIEFSIASEIKREAEYQRKLAQAHALSASGFRVTFDELGTFLPPNCYVTGRDFYGNEAALINVPFRAAPVAWGPPIKGLWGTLPDREAVVEVEVAREYRPGTIRHVQKLSGIVAPHPLDLGQRILDRAGDYGFIARILVGGPAGLACGASGPYNFFMGDGDVAAVPAAVRSDSSSYCAELVSSAKPPATAMEAAELATYSVNDLPVGSREKLDEATRVFVCRSSGAYQMLPEEVVAARARGRGKRK